jgi:hypothetical protein
VVPDVLVTVDQVFNYLTFTSTTPGLNGPLLDNVTLTPVAGPPPSPAPEPASLFDVGVGLMAGVVGWNRPRRNKAVHA